MTFGPGELASSQFTYPVCRVLGVLMSHQSFGLCISWQGARPIMADGHTAFIMVFSSSLWGSGLSIPMDLQVSSKSEGFLLATAASAAAFAAAYVFSNYELERIRF